MPTPQYVLDLRAVWGHRPLVLPGVSGVVFDDSAEPRRVLLVKRTDNGRWSLPAGIVEPGEQPADCIVRELWEEARVRAEPQRVALASFDEQVTYPNGDQCRYISLSFRLLWTGGEPEVGDDESTDVGWFDLDDLPESVTTTGRRRIEAARPVSGECLFDWTGGSR